MNIKTPFHIDVGFRIFIKLMRTINGKCLCGPYKSGKDNLSQM